MLLVSLIPITTSPILKRRRSSAALAAFSARDLL